ncbi:hypothetical protein PA25_15640 [Pseudoalteromonas sp. A25]|uniref:non-ribosomal peptide synthetase n=1 Tax=Pseudoalteromonas sp. A25 TaxID=116092 RepID=UPI0012606305|nr:non-ribosomal peptide synthetase [Pseudoalteromonas sp. A25]BBN81579.1 hypothetical protein PA25_15640 [Pseudoalteromonas sp. A25]
MDNLAIERFLADLDSRGIYVYLQNGKLKLRTKLERVPQEPLAQIKQFKEQLISYLNSQSQKQGRLSSAQQRIWFISQYEQQSYAYNMAGLIKFSRTICASKLNLAINNVLSCNDILKTNFFECDEGTVQRVNENYTFSLDLSRITGTPCKEQLVEKLHNELRYCFDLSNELLIRGTLFVDGSENQGQWLYLAMHHIIADGWSVELLVKAVLEELNDCTEQRANTLQYQDYVYWEMQFRKTDEYHNQLAYWQNQLTDLALFELPTCHARGANKSYQGDTARFTIQSVVLKRFEQTCKKIGVTPFVGFLSAYYVLLHRYSDKHDITVGVPVLNRTQAEFESMIGCFINTLPMRVKLESSPNFAQLALLVKGIVKDGLANQNVAVEDIIATLELPKSSAHSALYQILFNYNGVTSECLSSAGLSAELIPLENQSAKYDLTLTLSSSERGVSAEIDYSAHLFDSQFINMFASDFVALIEELSDEGEQQNIATISLPSVARSVELLARQSNSRAFVSIVERVIEHAQKDPQKIALIEGAEKQVSYAQLDRVSATLARALITDSRFSQDKPVALLVNRSANCIIAMLGIMRAGLAYLPIEQSTPINRILEVLEQASCDQLITMNRNTLSDNGSMALAQASVDVNFFDALLSEAKQKSEVNVSISAQDCAYVMFTSGSTGTPKGVLVPHRALTSYVNGVSEVIEFTANTRSAVLTGLATDLCLTGVYPVLAAGGSIVLIGADTAQLEPQLIADELAKQHVNFVKITPSFANEILPEVVNLQRTVAVDQWVFGGEPLPQLLVNSICRNFPNASIFNHYGPTETCIGVTACKVTDSSDFNWGSFSIGKPFSHVQLKILNSKLQNVPAGSPGELFIGGECIALGYINVPDHSTSAFVTIGGQRFYRSGDKVRLNPQGALEYLGRLDNQFKVRGFRVDVQDIESKLNSLNQVRTGVVTCVKREGDATLVAFVVPEPAELSKAALKQTIKTDLKLHLPEPMVPSVIVLQDELPLLANGKVDRKYLQSQPLTLDTNNYEKPCGNTQQKLAEMFEQLTAHAHVGIHDDFFVIGGHSLLAMKLLNRVKDHFGISVTLKTIFANPTVAELAAFIEDHEGGSFASEQIQLKNGRSEFHSGPFPLSYSQQRLWFVDQLQGHSSQYNLQGVFRLNGQLNSRCLEQAFNSVVKRHRILMFNYESAEDGTAQQFENPIAKFSLVFHELMSLDTEQQAKRIEQIIASDHQHSFDLERDLMIRGQLITLRNTEHLLVVTMHHIVSDGWSIDVLCKELSHFYRQSLKQQDVPLPPLTNCYIDYVYWQHEHFALSDNSAELGYWRDKLANLPKVHELPTDVPRCNEPLRGGALFCKAIPASLESQLRNYIKTSGHTLFLVLQTVFSVWLSRLSQTNAVAIGTPVSGRDLKQFEGLIGNFINTLVLFNEFNFEENFEQALTSSKQTLSEAIQNQSVPFDLLVEALNVERNISIHPMVQIVFRVNNQVNEALQLDGLEVEIVEPKIRQAKLDLEVSAIDTHEQIIVEWLYDTSLWQRNSIERFFEQYCYVLEQCLIRTDAKLSELEICAKAEQEAVLTYARFVEIDTLQTSGWHQKFSLNAKHYPELVALRDGTQVLTYGQLELLSNQLAHSILEMEFSPQSRIGILLPSGIAMVVSVLAILKLQHVYVPLHLDTPKAGIADIVNDANMVLILSLTENAEKLIESGTDFLMLDDLLEQQNNFSIYPTTLPKVNLLNHSCDLLSYIIYTSGSTGKPKGVAISHNNLNIYLQHACEAYLTEDSTIKDSVVCTPLAFDATVTSLLTPLVTGGAVNIVADDANQLPKLTDWLCNSSTDLLFKVTPAHLRAVQILTDNMPTCDSQHTVVVGGEALAVELISVLKRKFPKVKWINEYGPTETTVGSSIYTIDAGVSVEQLNSFSDMPIGLPIEQVGMLVVDRFDQIAPINVPGELLICGPSVSSGYVNHIALNESKFVDVAVPFNKGFVKQRFYRTGDVVKWHCNEGGTPSYLRYCGRTDDAIKLRGYRIEPGSICHHILQLDDIIDCAVTVDKAQSFLCVHYVAKSDTELDVTQLKKYLTDKLPSYMVPSQFNQVESLPLTANSKVDLQALHNSYMKSATRPATKAKLTALTSLQAYLLQLYSDVLQNPNVMLERSFFDQGGHSLLAIKLISRIRADKHFDITLAQLFKTPCILSLSEALQQCPLIEDDGKIMVVSRSERLPLSYAQHRLWLIEQVQQGAAQYHMPASYTVTGNLNLTAFKQAIGAIIERHEVLRTHILPGSSGEAPEQLINECFDVPCAVHDLSAIGADDAEKELNKLINEAQQGRFDLTRDVLLRVLIVKMSTEHYYLHFNMHHIASDGWSMTILLKEFIAFYRHFNEQPAHQLEERPMQPLPVQYADFAYWQRQATHQKAIEQSLSYWQTQLRNYPSLHQLPLDKPRPSVQQLEGQTVSQLLPLSLTNAINQQCAEQGVTLFMWLHSVFSLLVMRFSHTKDVLIGSPVAGREQPEISDLIGFFVNTIVIRAQSAETQSFEAFLQQQKKVIVDAFKHQAVPFEQLVEILQPERNLAHQPLFQILFALQSNEETEFKLPDLQITQLPTPSHNMKFDLEVNAIEQESGIELQWNFATSLFKRSSIKAMADSFGVMIQALVDKPSLNTSVVPLLTLEQQKYLVSAHTYHQNNSARSAVLALFEQMKNEQAERLAVISPDGCQWRFYDLQQRAMQLASVLRHNNVMPADRVALCLPPSADMIAAMLGVWFVGATYVPVDPKLPTERCQYILHDAQVNCVILNEVTSSNEVFGKSLALDIAMVNMDELGQSHKVEQVSPIVHDGLAYIIYTSGSTGKPKGVAISHKSLEVYLNHAVTSYLDSTINMAVLSTPMAFDASVTTIWAPLCSGVPVNVLADDKNIIASLADRVFSSAPALFKLTPAHLQGLLHELPAKPVMTRHMMVIGGEALSVKMVEQLSHYLPNCMWFNEYGPTEATVGTSIYCANKDNIQALTQLAEHTVPIGRPIANTQLLVLDEHKQLVPPGVMGELYIAGANLAQGYFNNIKLTEQKFTEIQLLEHDQPIRCYQTGDQVRWLTDENAQPTQLQFYGRYDRQIKLRGYRIELGEIESHLEKLPEISQAVVLLNKQQQTLEALVTFKKGIPELIDHDCYVLERASLDPMLQRLATTLPHYMQPNKVIALKAMPLTVNGKVDTNKLKAISSQSVVSTQQVAPRNEFETALVEIFSSLLNVDGIGISDSFFALGGHSLIATQCVSIIKEQLQVDIPVKVLFERPTVAAISQWYAINHAAGDASSNSDTSDTSEEMFL